MQKTSKRVLALVLAFVMVISVFSISASANGNYDPTYQSETHTVFKHTEQTLAPGVEYYNNYAYSSEGKQMVYYVATADISRDDVVVQTSYLNQYKDRQPGMSKLSEQVAFANQYYTDSTNPLYLSDNYNVVAGVNASFYNMQTGQPTGICYVDGVSFGTVAYPAFFAILKDPETGAQTAVMDDTANVDNYENIWQAVGGQYWLVRDGADVTADASGSYLTDRHSRTVVGITDDGKVVLMVLDGRQEPFSAGGTMHELAQIMIEAGCKYAMNIDGGGSTTFGSRPEGEDSFRVINRPSDGSERSISSGLIIGSLAAPTTDFDHVTMTVADEYVTPGTATDLTVTGVSASGSSAEIPAEVTYDVTLGAVVDGQFVSDGTEGDAVITAMYQGNAVGSATVHVVVPDAVDITSETVTIPYGKSADIPLVTKYGLNEVAHKASDFTITIDNPAAGTVDGLVFTAAGESDIASTGITVALNGTDLSDTATLLFGKGSDVIFDFEDGTTQGFNLNYSGYNYYLPNSKVFVADRENGQVHSGNYALGLNIDYTNSQESGYQMIALYQGKVSGNANYYEDAIDMGTWLYIPDEYVGLWVRWTISPISAITENAETGEKTYSLGSINSNAMDRGAGGTGVVYSFDEPGWHYLHADLSQYKGLAWRDYYYCMQFYISDRDGAGYGYYAKNNHNINGNFTVYMDDVTVDYSTVVEDRDAPVFTSVLLGDDGPHSNDALVLTDGYDSDGYNKLSFSARVADYDATNATGINGDACKAYIDGNDVGCSYNGTGMITAGEEVTLNEGKHTVKFVAYDNAGNRSSVTRTFTVSNVSRKEFIKVVPHDASLDRVLHGALYWVDIVTTEAENTSKVITTLNLDSMSTWELDHMVVADGFTASYEVVDEGDKIVKITIEAEGEVEQTGELALVSIPIRTWEMDNKIKYNTLNGSTKKWNYAEFKASNEFWPVGTEVRVQQGLAYYKGGHRYFTGEDVFVWSESWANNANMVSTQEGKDYKAAWNGGHDHRPEYADYYAVGTTNYVAPRVSKAAQAPSCTEEGWTEELFCDTCNSVVQWSEPIPATGHHYEFNASGVLACKDCDAPFNGVYDADGKLYDDGIPAEGWHNDNTNYYIDGLKIKDAAYVIDGDPYVFDADGNVSADGLDNYAGLVYDLNTDDIYFVALGNYKTGWQTNGDDYYYFSKEDYKALKGEQVVSGHEYTFSKEGVLLEGSFYNDNGKIRYAWAGNAYNKGWLEVEGKTYYGDINGVILTGIQRIETASNSHIFNYYLFDETGALVEGNGFVDYDGETYYMVDNILTYAGLIEIDGAYYYVNSHYHPATGEYYVYKTNGLMDEGTYEFDSDGKMILPEEPDPEKTGFYDEDGKTYYYVAGVKTYAGLILVDGDYYYVKSDCSVVKDCSYFVWTTNDLMDRDWYDFDADGKMIIPGEEPTDAPTENPDAGKNGFYDEDGKTYYYVDGVKTYAGLIKVGDDYYYVKSDCSVVKDCNYFVWTTNDLMDQDWYDFDADGKMILPEPDYYLKGDFNGWNSSDEYKFVENPNAEGEYMLTYVEIDADQELKVWSSDDVWYPGDNTPNCHINDAGIYNVYFRPAGNSDQAWYYGYFYLEKLNNVKNGFYDEDGATYYYVNDKKTYAGLIEVDGAYYYVKSNCTVVKDCSYFVWTTNDLMDQGWYNFDADGKMILD